MSPLFAMRNVSARWCSLLLGASMLLGMPSRALAQSSLTWARVERLRNQVHLIPAGSRARRARVADTLGIGDALRTALSARAELRFNDGSLARVGEQATFRFTPNTRNFQLSNGTVLLLIPPGRGRTTIQTPNAVTGIQGSALFVRVRCLVELTAESTCDSPVTVVGALTNNPAGAMMAYTGSGSGQQPIYAGEMVIIEGDTISQLVEFDLRTFYETSGLVEGLGLDSPTPPDELSDDLQGVWQEIQDALELQGDFDEGGAAEEIVENPTLITPVVTNTPQVEDVDSTTDDGFEGFPSFANSPAYTFHSLEEESQIATSGEVDAPPDSGGDTTGLRTPVGSTTVADTPSSATGEQPSTVNQSVGQPVGVQPTTSGGSFEETPVVPTTPAPTNTGGTPAPSVTPTEPVTTVDVVEQPGVDTPVVTPEATPGATVVPETAPEVVEPTQPVTEPVQQPVEVVTPQQPVESPTIVADQPTTVPETEPVTGREAAPTETFDWDNQPAGVDQPEVLPTEEVQTEEPVELVPELVPEN